VSKGCLNPRFQAKVIPLIVTIAKGHGVIITVRVSFLPNLDLLVLKTTLFKNSAWDMWTWIIVNADSYLFTYLYFYEREIINTQVIYSIIKYASR